MNFAHDHIVGDVELFIFVQAAVINRVVVALSQVANDTLRVFLPRDYSVNDGNALAWQLVDNDITILNRRVFCQKKDISSLHRWLHGSR